jgi:hypothetical protein
MSVALAAELTICGVRIYRPFSPDDSGSGHGHRADRLNLAKIINGLAHSELFFAPDVQGW